MPYMENVVNGAAMDDSVETALISIKKKYDFFDFKLKEEQTAIIRHLLDKKDVFGLLPTGFGKSMTFTLLPLILDELKPSERHTALIISPLRALIAHQMEVLDQYGVKACTLSDQTIQKDIKETGPSILFGSPEAIVLPKWRSLLKEHVRKELCILVFDEAHCISSWGLDFRPAYRQVSFLQSLFDIPLLALTATATKKIQKDIYEVLSLQGNKTEVVAALPDRPNIFLHIRVSSENYEIELQWILKILSDKNNNRKKVVIYVKSINQCYHLYLWLMMDRLEKCSGDKFVTSRRQVEMFHANTDSETKSKIMEQFIKEDGEIQILIATVAFGMGVNISNIDVVVHWGMPSSILSFWQEIGRCARDGRPGYAICYAYKRSLSKCKEEELKELANPIICLRFSVLVTFSLKVCL